jgi:opacity protein-like surface antigen
MKNLLMKSLVALTLSAAMAPALAQETPAPSPNNGGISGGVSGSAGLGIDFGASNATGANQEQEGGFVESIERALAKPGTECGRLKCY